MLIADKIYKLRKEMDISQEELADKLGVSRQSISKWESAMSIPDMNRILQLSEFFGVSTDYLLKDDVESYETQVDQENIKVKRLSAEYVNEFFKKREAFAKLFSISVPLFILSVVPLIVLVNQNNGNPYNEAIGLMSMFVMIALGVGIIIVSTGRISEYQILEKGEFILDYGVIGIVKEKQKIHQPKHIRHIAIAVMLFILASIPVIMGGVLLFDETQMMWMLAMMFAMIASGVGMIIYSSSIKKAYDVLLQVEDFDPELIRHNREKEPYQTLYWMVITVVYLLVSFLTFMWHITWLIWPIAGIFSYILFDLFKKPR